MSELKTQVEFLEKQIHMIQPQLNKITERNQMLDNFSINISDKQKYLIELGYSDIETYRSFLKQNLGKGNVKKVLEDILQYIVKDNLVSQDISDEIILFNSRLSDIEFKSRGGLLSFENETVERQRIYKGVLELIKNL